MMLQPDPSVEGVNNGPRSISKGSHASTPAILSLYGVFKVSYRSRLLSRAWHRSVRWTSFGVSFAVLLSCLTLVPFQVSSGKNAILLTLGQSDSPNGKGCRVPALPPQPGPLAENLPNLDDLRRSADEALRNGPRPISPAP